MATTVSSTTLVKEWSSPQRRVVQGQPPGPEVKNKETSKAEFRRQDIRLVTPVYKGQSEQTTTTTSSGAPYMNGSLKSGYTLKSESNINSQQFQGAPDYKEETETEQYRLRIIDPKIESHSTIPVTSQTLPSAYRKRNKFDLFPSSHSKRSFMKLEALEQPGQRNRVRSTDLRPITPVEYLSESIERHRQLEQSKLRDELKVKEKEVNQPWDKPKLKEPEPLREVNVKTHYESRTLNGNYPGSLLMTRRRYPQRYNEEEFDSDQLYTASDSEVLVINSQMKRHRQHLKPSPLHLSLTDEFDDFEGVEDSLRSQSAPPHESPTVEILSISVSDIKDAYERQLVEDETKKVRSTSVVVSPPLEELRNELTVPSGGLIPSASSMTSGMSRITAWHDQSLTSLANGDKLETEKSAKNRPVTPHPQKDPNMPRNQHIQQQQIQQTSYKSSTTNVSHHQQFLSEETDYERQIRLASSNFAQLDTNRSTVNGKTPLSYPIDCRNEAEFSQHRAYHYETPIPNSQTPVFDTQEVYENKPLKKYADASFEESQHDLIATNVAELKGRFDGGFDTPDPRKILPKPPVKSWQKQPTFANWEPLNERSTLPKQVTFERPVEKQSAQSQQYQQQSDQTISWPPPPTPETFRVAQKTTRYPSAPFDGPPYPAKLTPLHSYSNPRSSSPTRPYGAAQANRTPMVNQFGQVYFDNSTPMMPPRQPPYLEREKAKLAEESYQEQLKKNSNSNFPEAPLPKPYTYEPPQRKEKVYKQPARKVDINQQQFDSGSFQFPQQQQQQQPVRRDYYEDQSGDEYQSGTWRRTYVLPNERPGLVRNRIATSQEILAEELPYGPDVSAIKSAFTPKPASMPEIQRTGRRWQPPPEEPPILPRARNPLYSPTQNDSDGFHLWQPAIRQPEYKYERKNFTPPNSPVQQQRRPVQKVTHNHSRSLDHSDDFNWTNFETPRQQQQRQQQRYSRDNSTDLDDNSSLDVRMRVVQPGINAQQRNPTPTRSHLVSTTVQTEDLRTGRGRIVDTRGQQDDRSGRRSSQESYQSAPERPRQQRRPEYFSLGNEPTGRHPSTLTGRDKLKIDISRRIRLYEPSVKQSQKSVKKRQSAVEDDTSDVDSRLSDRAVRFADRSNVLLHKLNQPVDMYFKVGDDSQLELTAGPYKQSLPLSEMPKVITSTPQREKEWDDSDQYRSRSYTNLQATSANWRFSGASFSPKSVVSINGDDNQGRYSSASSHTMQKRMANASVQTLTGDSGTTTTTIQTQQIAQPQYTIPYQGLQAILVPISTLQRDYREERRSDRYSSLPVLDRDDYESEGHGTLIKIKDDRVSKAPKSIMRQTRKDVVKEEIRQDTPYQPNMNGAMIPVKESAVREVIQKVEETKRVEEIERTVREKKKKEKSSRRNGGGGEHRHHHSSRHRSSRHRSSDRDREAITSGAEQHQHQRQQHQSSHEWTDSGRRGVDFPLWTQPFGQSQLSPWKTPSVTTNGSLASGSLREHKRNQHVREVSGSSNQTHSTVRQQNGQSRQQHGGDKLQTDLPPDYDEYSTRPFVEFPPTLPRDSQPDGGRMMTKSRSFNDWDDWRGKGTVDKWWQRDGASGLEREFHETLLMPAPRMGENADDHDYKENPIAGGKESLGRDFKAQTGAKPNGTRFSTSSQSVNYKRESSGRM